MTDTTRERHRLSERLAALDLPEENKYNVAGPGDLVMAIATQGDGRGRYYAWPLLLRRLFWWQETPESVVKGWRDKAVRDGDLTIQPIAQTAYDNRTFDVAVVTDMRRWRPSRISIPRAVRLEVYARDGFRCQHCGSRESLTLDHMHPWSRGGSDDAANLQTLCRSCNSRKGARV